MNRLLVAVSLSLILASTLSGQPTEEWRNWKFWGPLQLQSTHQSRLVRVKLPLSVFGKAQENLADLRIIDADGDEVAALRHARPGDRRHRWRTTRLSESGFVPGRYTQFVVDTGGSGELHNSVWVRTDEKDFFARVEVAGSRDLEEWQVLRDGAPIFRFEKDHLRGSQTISYPGTRSRWLRLRILLTEKLFPVRECRVSFEEVEEAERLSLAEARRNPESTRGESWWEADLGVPGVPIAALSFETSQNEFHRPVIVSTSQDNQQWREVGQGEIYRYPQESLAIERSGSELQEKHERIVPFSSLQVEFKESRGRYWRVAVLNRNDPPLEGLRVQALGTPRYVLFRQEPGRLYRLLYGNSRVEAPRYDLERLVSRDERQAAPLGEVGKEESNPNYVSPEPWTEQHPLLLWLALGVAAGILAWLALREMRA